MRSIHRQAKWLVLGMTSLTLAACDSTGTAPQSLAPVAVRLAASSAPASGTSAAAVQISSFQVVVGAASLGSGDQFGCQDCQGDQQEVASTPKIINVPLGGGAVEISTEQVQPGQYAQAEISVEAPTAATLAGVSGWPGGATMQITGTFGGRPFTLPLSITGSFVEQLQPPVVVAASTPNAVPVTITLPVASWFVANGAALDPTVPAQRALIEANARSSFGPPEAGGTPEND